MFSSLKRIGVAALLAAIAALLPLTALAQSGEQKSGDAKSANPSGDAGKEAAKRMADEFLEATRTLGGPAANPECVWLGRRAVSLLWRDDLDTAFRHLDLYDRFGCPGGHVQSTFRCVIRQGSIDPKAPESLSARVHACWVNPAMEPQATAQVPSVPAPGTKP